MPVIYVFKLSSQLREAIYVQYVPYPAFLDTPEKYEARVLRSDLVF